MDVSLETIDSYLGRPVSELPTPSVILSKPILESNIQKLSRDVKDQGIGFRPHVKTLKSLEVTRLMLNGGAHRKIVASTLREIRGVLPLVKEGILDEALYGIPIYTSALSQLSELSKSIKIVLMIDNDQHIQLLEDFSKKNPSAPQKWNVFIKVDTGYHRAGLMTSSPALRNLVQKAEASPVVDVYGFYCHAGHSYKTRSSEEAAAVLQSEVDCVVQASSLLPADRDVVVSVGSTPAAHVVQLLKAALPSNVKLELHAGNYPCNDLQQVSTGLVTESQQALRLLAEVCSVYPERNEALINAGTIALSKETSDFQGQGLLVDDQRWGVVRTSQEHGILGLRDATKGEGRIEECFKVGQKVLLYCHHACITASAHFVYYVVDEEDVVREAWIPWKGW